MMVVPEKTGPVRGSFIENPSDKRPCWSCDAEIQDRYSCAHCSVIQTFLKESDYFTCFELGWRLQLDLASLEKQYYKLSRKFHPDYFQQKSPEEQDISLENTALLTQAYRTLKDPMKRVAYLIRLVEGEQRIATEAPADLFEEIFEIQEDLQDLRECSDEDTGQKKALTERLNQSLTKMKDYQFGEEKALEGFFSEWDGLELLRQQGSLSDVQKKCVSGMKDILSHRAYVDRIIQDIQNTISV